MDLWAHDFTRANAGKREWLEFYAASGEKTYGAIRVLAGELYVSKRTYDFDEAKSALQRAKLQFPNASLKQYGVSRKVIWVHVPEKPHDDQLLHDQYLRLPLSDRIYNRLEFPQHRVQPLNGCLEALEQQRELHARIGGLHEQYVLPLLAHGMCQADALRWLRSAPIAPEDLAKSIGAKKDERLRAYAKIPAEIFRQDPRSALRDITTRADALEGHLKSLRHGENNFLERCWEDVSCARPFRSIIHLAEWRDVLHGFSRLFA